MNTSLDLNSKRAIEARLGNKIGKNTYWALAGSSTVSLMIAVALIFINQSRFGLILFGLSLIMVMPAIWWKRYLSILPANGTDLTGRLSVDVLSRLNPNEELSCKNFWFRLGEHWQANFVLNHLLLLNKEVAQLLEVGDRNQLDQALNYAVDIANKTNSNQIELGFVIAGLMMASPAVNQLISQIKGRPEDIQEVAVWLGRNIVDNAERSNKNSGGVGRDWAFGYTPLLNRLGVNVSLSISKYNSHFGWLMESEGVKSLEALLSQNNSAVALIGQIGIGKSSNVYALAQRLIEGKTSSQLAYHQVISVNATDITSNAHGQGELEHLMISLANEAAHAGHIILFLDDAEAFFSEGPGAFDASQILLTLAQSRSLSLIVALTPNGFERLKARNPNLASLLTPIVLKELSEMEVMKVLEDTALGLEGQHRMMIAYSALVEAYHLSGRYDQDEAYPGRAIKLLQQSVSYATNSVVTARSVQKAIEQAKGIKLGSAGPAEANELLNLEDKIHQRMINQSQAVSAVANSLRRARAGVTNPKRPIGSFMFLGPTGVGKTELAKSLAATYFGAETSMIRLDMSEYQQEADVSRLLSDGQNESKSLILAVRQQPFSVILLDEIEKAHPNILNLMLQLLDEGQLTDTAGRPASFKDCIIIATSNAGAQTIRQRVQAGQNPASFKSELLDELINSGQFRPELINRFDEIVLFRPLNPDELAQVVKLMLAEINQTLSNQNISVSLTAEAVAKIVTVGYDPRLGARPMRRTMQHAVEDTVAQKILKGEVMAGQHVSLDAADLKFN
jgi:ATP-dependent Clp protease ATP-binding subunit ClpC